MHMRTFDEHEPLTDAELDRLGEFLQKCKGGKAMNIEEIDGFFSALIAGPEVVMPSEYLPEIFGGEMSDTCEFKELDQANDILGLLMRHWNTIAATLHKDEVYVPILLKGENGACLGNDWARGFMRGVEFCRDAWGELITDEKQGVWMLPVLMLYHEHDEDSEMRPEPIGPEKREEIIVQMAAGVVGAYRYFRPQRQRVASAYAGETRRSPVKIGRNEPCPCGSGKKYKRCCGGATIH
jgi:uncharacterized protein